jgi:ribosomal protein S30
MFFAQAIFDPRGSFVKGGNDVDDYKVVSSKMTAKQSEKVTPRRRLRMKYSTVTGNGYVVERRALLDAYQVGTEVFMLMTSSNAVNFEKKGRERDTVEAIVDSFRIGDM